LRQYSPLNPQAVDFSLVGEWHQQGLETCPAEASLALFTVLDYDGV